MNTTDIVYFYLLLFTLGCTSLAFLYHLVLYLQRREKLLLHYWIYLGLLSAFLLSRVLLSDSQRGPDHLTWRFQFWDELLQLLFYYGYIEFVGRALSIRPQTHPRLYFFWKTLAWIILGIAAAHALLMLTDIQHIRNRYLFRGSRVLLILVSLMVLMAYAFRSTTVFQRYILAGALIFLVTGTLGFASFVYNFSIWNVYALGFTFIGEVADVLLFSAAMGYRLRKTFEEKEEAMKELEIHREMVRQKDLEHLQAVMETRYEERNRIARELHDEVGSSLSSIHIFSTVAGQPEKTGDMIKKIQDTSSRVMENMSDLVWAINAETDDSNSLLRRIRQFGSALLEAKNMELEVIATDIPENLRLRTDAKKNILLICKEALNNIAKYSGAKKAVLSVETDKRNLILEIRDNGAGILPGHTEGNGLVNMKKRCMDSGGEFTLETGPGSGTLIRCVFTLTNISN